MASLAELFKNYNTKTSKNNLKNWLGNSEHIDENKNPLIFRNYGLPFNRLDTSKGKFGGIFVLPAELDAEFHNNNNNQLANYLYLKGNSATSNDIDDYFRDVRYGRKNEKKEFNFLNNVIGKKVINEDNIKDLADSVTQEGLLENIQNIANYYEGDDFALMQKLRGSIAKRLGFSAADMYDEYAGNSKLIVDPYAIKSATDNTGEFNPKTSNILRSHPAATLMAAGGLAGMARSALNEPYDPTNQYAKYGMESPMSYGDVASTAVGALPGYGDVLTAAQLADLASKTDWKKTKRSIMDMFK
jgi:hypothetical protein